MRAKYRMLVYVYVLGGMYLLTILIDMKDWIRDRMECEVPAARLDNPPWLYLVSVCKEPPISIAKPAIIQAYYNFRVKS